MGGYQASAQESNQPTASELEQAVEAARKLEGIVDYVQIRVSEHPNAWNQDEDKPKPSPMPRPSRRQGSRSSHADSRVP